MLIQQGKKRFTKGDKYYRRGWDIIEEEEEAKGEIYNLFGHLFMLEHYSLSATFVLQSKEKEAADFFKISGRVADELQTFPASKQLYRSNKTNQTYITSRVAIYH